MRNRLFDANNNNATVAGGDDGPVYAHTTNGYSWCSTYTGTGASLAITGLGFQPDFIIIGRATLAASQPGKLYQRSVGAGGYLSLTGGARVTDVNSMTSFDADGFTLGTGAASNVSGGDYWFVAWKAINAFAAEFTYTGDGANRTVAHGLGATPSVFMGFETAALGGNFIYHEDNGNTKITLFISTVGSTNAAYFNSTSPDGTNVSLGTGANTTNENTKPYTALVLADVAGKMATGIYTGNGSASGPTVSGLGFIPYGIITFRLLTASGCLGVFPENGDTLTGVPAVYIDTSTANIATAMTIDADGFTVTTTDADMNASGTNYLFIAFAA